MTTKTTNPGALAGATGAENKAGELPHNDSEASARVKPRTPQDLWRERNPLAYWAHQSLRSGLKRGLVAPESCAVCGDPKSEAHHPDYDRPLAVEWLCRRHHKAAHAAQRRAKG